MNKIGPNFVANWAQLVACLVMSLLPLIEKIQGLNVLPLPWEQTSNFGGELARWPELQNQS